MGICQQVRRLINKQIPNEGIQISTRNYGLDPNKNSPDTARIKQMAVIIFDEEPEIDKNSSKLTRCLYTDPGSGIFKYIKSLAEIWSSFDDIHNT